MRLHRRLWVVGLVALALGCWFLATADRTSAQGKGGAVTIPDEDFKLLVESSNKVIQQALGDKPDKRAAAKARTAAIYIALYSQADKTKAEQRGGVGAAALQLAEQIKTGKFDEAKKLSAQLATMKAGGKADAVALGKQIELDEVMMHFHRDKLGGTDLEFKLLNLSNDRASKKGKALDAKLMNDELLVMAYQAAIVTEFVKEHDPGKMKKDWTKHAEETSNHAMDLAKAVKAKNGSGAWTALNKVNGSCTDCHNKFK